MGRIIPASGNGPDLKLESYFRWKSGYIKQPWSGYCREMPFNINFLQK